VSNIFRYVVLDNLHCLATGHEHFEHVLLLSGQTKTLLAIYIHSSPERTSPRLPFHNVRHQNATHLACRTKHDHASLKLTTPALPYLCQSQTQRTPPCLPKHTLLPPERTRPHHACHTLPKPTVSYPNTPASPHRSTTHLTPQNLALPAVPQLTCPVRTYPRPTWPAAIKPILTNARLTYPALTYPSATSPTSPRLPIR